MVVPGHWAFNGWKDQNALDGDYLTGSIPNVNRDYVLVGYWLFGTHVQYQLSYFGGDNEGLVMAEVELESETEAYEKPDFIDREVTGDKRFYNSHLLTNPFYKWRDSL